MGHRERTLLLVGSALAVSLVLGVMVRAEPASPPDADAPPPAPPAATHVPGLLQKPADILKGLPAFTVTPRTPKLIEAGVYPCSDCHDASMPADPTPRVLIDEHGDMEFVHGRGRFWCLTCHSPDDRDQLQSLRGQPIGFDESHLLCGQCHFGPQRDFVHGAHGKRLNSWRGERVLTPCTGCHDAHSPSIKPRKPMRAERLREGLVPVAKGPRSLLLDPPSATTPTSADEASP